MTARRLCAGTSCQRSDSTRQGSNLAVEGARLCLVCRSSLAAGLECLPHLYQECERLLGGSEQPRDKTSGGPMPGMPFNSASAETRTAILGVLASWGGTVAKERRVDPPHRTVSALADFLGRHVNWLAAHTAAAKACEDVARLVRDARRVVFPSSVRRVPVGACVESNCAGNLIALISAETPQQQAGISCDIDPHHQWLDHEWIQLSLRMETTNSAMGVVHTVPRWFSVADVARLWQTVPGSVYRLASEHQWRRRSRAGHTYYHEADIQKTFSQRKTRPPRAELG
jgi:hypothetical protein